MNDEEILDNTLEYLEGIDETRNTKILTINETNILLNYITNLQESEAYYYGQYKDYKSRNEKAIEYIKNNCYYLVDNDDKKLLNILNGDDEE